MVNGSSGDSVTNVETALKSQNAATVVRGLDVGSGVGGCDDKNLAEAVHRHPGTEIQRSPSHPESDLPAVKYQSSPSPRGGPKPDRLGEISDAMSERGTEVEKTIESLANVIAGLSGEQQKTEQGALLRNLTSGTAVTEQDTSVQEVPGSKSKESEQATASSEHNVLTRISVAKVNSNAFPSPSGQAPNSSILAEQTSSNKSTIHFSSMIHDDLSKPPNTSQLLSPNVHTHSSMVQPEFPKVVESPDPSHSQTPVISSVEIPLFPSASAPIDDETQHRSRQLFPIPTDHPPPPMTAADMTNAILGLTFPFPPLEPPLPPQEEGRRIDAYVKLTFDDGNVYYIKNAAVVFGRAELSSRRRDPDRDRGTRGSGESLRTVRGHQRMSKRTSSSKKSKSTSSSASINCPRTPNNSRRTSIAMTTQTGLISSYDESARPFFTDPFTGNKPAGATKNAATRMNEEALIHLPPTGEPVRKNISRRHARLSFNVEKGAFELEVMGKNGAFVEDEWVERGSTWLLNKEGGHIEPSGEKAWRIQIGGVGFALMFPPRDPLEGEESGVAAVGKEGQEGMSLAFLDGSGKEITTDFNEEEAEEGEEDEDEKFDEAEEGSEEADSDLEAEENSYVMAQSPEESSEDDSSGRHEEPRPPVRGKSFINGYSVPYIDRDDDEDEDGDEDDEENGDLGRVEEGKGDEDNEDEDVTSNSDNSGDGDNGDDDGDDYLGSRARKRKLASQGKKPITRKNIKILEALKRPKISQEQESRRGRGRPKKPLAGKAVTSKGSNKGVPKKQPVPLQQNEREKDKERRKQEKERRLREIRDREERDREERLRKLREEEKKHAKAEQKSAKREAKEQLQKERQLKKEQELKEILAQKKIEKAEKERREKEQRLLERQEKLIREARDKEAALQAKRRATGGQARQSMKLCLPTISPSAALLTPGSALRPLQLPTASSSATVPADTLQGSPSRPSDFEYADSKEQTSAMNYHNYSQFTGNQSPKGFDTSYHQRMSTPLPVHASTRGGYASMKESSLKETRPKKEKLPPKRKRSPSPPLNEADFPPEALLKPNASYLILIHEAISNSEKKMLSLPDIYRAIQRKYPYFKLRVTTTGWQSSVRHNLSQSSAFQKVQREGKGWLWRITEGFNIEKEKKKKLLPPPPPSQVIHPPHSNYGQMIPNDVGSVPIPKYGVVHGQQPGLPLQNGVYMTNRPPATTIDFSHHPLHGANVPTQQPTKYQQAGQQLTAMPNVQPNPTTTNASVYTPGALSVPAISNSIPISGPRSTVPRAPIPPPPISNASRIQMAQLASRRPCEQRPSQVLTPRPPVSSPVSAVKFTSIDTATLLAFDKVLADAEKNPPPSDGTSMQGVGYAQLRTLVKYALDPTSAEHEKSKQLLIGALQLMQKQKQQQPKLIPGPVAGRPPTVAAPQKTTVPQISLGTSSSSAAIKSPIIINTPVPSSISASAPSALHSTSGISTFTTKASVSTQLPSPAPTPATTVSTSIVTAVQPPVQAPNPPTTTASASSVSPQPPQSAAKPTPRATSQQLLDLLARLKAQKMVQQSQTTPPANSSMIGGSVDTSFPRTGLGVKRPLEQISTVMEDEEVGRAVTEGPAMKRVDIGLGQNTNQSEQTGTRSDEIAENSTMARAPVVEDKEGNVKSKISE